MKKKFLLRQTSEDYEIWDIDYEFEDTNVRTSLPIAVFAKERFTLKQVKENVAWLKSR